MTELSVQQDQNIEPSTFNSKDQSQIENDAYTGTDITENVKCGREDHFASHSQVIKCLTWNCWCPRTCLSLLLFYRKKTSLFHQNIYRVCKHSVYNYAVSTVFEKQKLELVHMYNCFPTRLCSKNLWCIVYKLKQRKFVSMFWLNQNILGQEPQYRVHNKIFLMLPLCPMSCNCSDFPECFMNLFLQFGAGAQ